MNIAIFYHCLFYHGTPPELRMPACDIIARQMQALEHTGLAERADYMLCGINGPVEESMEMAAYFLPYKAVKLFHGPKSFAENLTIVQIEEWAKTHRDWGVLYFHSKGATHNGVDGYSQFSAVWREGMMQDLVHNWRECVQGLEQGFDVVCSHWMWNMADGTQHIPAGNFLWARADFIASLPSIFLRERIKQDGIAAASSRYEAEVYWGNGRRPNVKQFRPAGGGGVP